MKTAVMPMTDLLFNGTACFHNLGVVPRASLCGVPTMYASASALGRLDLAKTARSF